MRGVDGGIDHMRAHARDGVVERAERREIALELALNNYLIFQTFKLGLQHTAISATQLAEDTDRNFLPTSKMPTPSMVSN